MDNEQYGKSPCVEAIELIKRWNEVDEVLRIAASARFVEERILNETKISS